MRLSVKHLRMNEYSHTEDEVPPGTKYGVWRVVEHTNAGWFPWPGLYDSKAGAERAMKKALEKTGGRGMPRNPELLVVHNPYGRRRKRKKSRSRRRRARNSWVNNKAGHRKAAKKGWRRRKKRKSARRRHKVTRIHRRRRAANSHRRRSPRGRRRRSR
jgi:hypothetical protein